MTELLTHPLVLPVLVPLVAGLVCLVLPRALDVASALIALAASLATAVLVWPLFRGTGQVADLAFGLNLRVDALSGFVLLATTVFAFLIALYSVGYMKGRKGLGDYYAYLLWTLAASCGALMANELVLLVVFWGFLGFTLYQMVALGGPDAAAAAKKTFIVIGGSDSILVIGVALIAHLAGTTRMDAAPIALEGSVPYIAFVCLAIAAFAKAGAMPFHTWVPDCGEKAPASVVAFLPASLDKLLGIYLLARVAGSIFVMDTAMSVMLMAVGAATIILAVMMALVQHDMRRLLSYHAVSQVGYMVLGIGTGLPIGVAGGLFHMVNHAMYKSCLFLCAGSVEKAAGTSDLDNLGGLARAMPLTFFSCFVAAMSISGIPPLNGFASKWMVYQGLIAVGNQGGWLWTVWLAAAMLGSALTLASFAKLLHAVYLRRPAPQVAARSISESGPSMWLPMVFLAVMCIVFGVAAYRLPIRYLIAPALGGHVGYIGTWWAGPASVALVVALMAGLLLFAVRGLKARECRTYIGGEYMEEAYVAGEPGGTQRDVEVTGVDFYHTIREMAFFRTMYRMAEAKYFDIYEMGARLSFMISRALQLFHTGVLRTYVVWYIVGVIVLLFCLGRGV